MSIRSIRWIPTYCRQLDDFPFPSPQNVDRVDPGGRDLAGDNERASPAGVSRSVRIRKPGSGSDCEPDACRFGLAGTGREPITLAVGGANAGARIARADRRSLRRADHAGRQEGRGRQGPGQLGFRLRYVDRFVQGDQCAARQAGRQTVRQSDDRLHLHRRHRLHLSRRNSGRAGAEEFSART